MPSSLRLIRWCPDRTFHNFRANKSGDRKLSTFPKPHGQILML